MQKQPIAVTAKTLVLTAITAFGLIGASDGTGGWPYGASASPYATTASLDATSASLYATTASPYATSASPYAIGASPQEPANASQDWPQWRGPHGTGVAEGASLPVTWSEDANLAWKSPINGLGVSSPVVAGERVFVTYQLGRGERAPGTHPTLVRDPEVDPSMERPLGGEAATRPDPTVEFAVAGYDRSDGRLLWEHVVAARGPLPPVHDKHNLASPSPVTDAERVYAWFGTGQLVALDVAGGAEIWQRHLGERYSFEIQWGHASSPTLYGDSLVLLSDHGREAKLLWIDKLTGEEQRSLDRGASLSSHSTPMVVPGPNGDELIVNSSERLESFDPDTGELLWFTGEPNRFPIGVATHAGGILYTSRGYRSGPYMAIRLGGRGQLGDEHVLWRVPTGAPYISSLLFYDGHIYMANGNGIVTVTDPASGRRLWQERVGGIFASSPVGGDGKVYLFSETGEGVVLEAGPSPRVLSRNDLGERIIASPAISNGRIFVRTDQSLIAIGG